MSGVPQPFKTEFNKQVNIYEIQALLASYVLPAPSRQTVSSFGSAPPPNDLDHQIPYPWEYPDETPATAPPPLPEASLTSPEEEARVLFELAKQTAKSGNNQQALQILSRITRDYPMTKYAAPAQRAIDSSKRK